MVPQKITQQRARPCSCKIRVKAEVKACCAHCPLNLLHYTNLQRLPHADPHSCDRAQARCCDATDFCCILARRGCRRIHPPAHSHCVAEPVKKAYTTSGGAVRYVSVCFAQCIMQGVRTPNGACEKRDGLRTDRGHRQTGIGSRAFQTGPHPYAMQCKDWGHADCEAVQLGSTGSP